MLFLECVVLCFGTARTIGGSSSSNPASAPRAPSGFVSQDGEGCRGGMVADEEDAIGVKRDVNGRKRATVGRRVSDIVAVVGRKQGCRSSVEVEFDIEMSERRKEAYPGTPFYGTGHGFVHCATSTSDFGLCNRCSCHTLCYAVIVCP